MNEIFSSGTLNNLQTNLKNHSIFIFWRNIQIKSISVYSRLFFRWGKWHHIRQMLPYLFSILSTNVYGPENTACKDLFPEPLNVPEIACIVIIMK